MMVNVQTARFVQRSQLQNVEIYNYRVILLAAPLPWFRTKMIDDRRPRSQPKAILDEGFVEKQLWLANWHFFRGG